MQTLELRLLKCSYDCVKAHIGADKKAREKYIIWTKSLGAMIQSSGLAQAMAFLESKAAKNEGDALGFKWLKEDLSQEPIVGQHGTDIAEVAKSAAAIEYAALTRRVMLALVYFQRFAESLLEDQTSQNKQEEEANS
jgi:CRISPR type III-B/RAMP module-associated protein Cmr5